MCYSRACEVDRDPGDGKMRTLKAIWAARPRSRRVRAVREANDALQLYVTEVGLAADLPSNLLKLCADVDWAVHYL